MRLREPRGDSRREAQRDPVRTLTTGKGSEGAPNLLILVSEGAPKHLTLIFLLSLMFFCYSRLLARVACSASS